MIPEELVRQIRLLEIRTNRMVNEISGGAYRSVFKGAGIEFEEVREYTIEDDVRSIDWNVSARMGVPYVKKFVEERELNVMLLVDVSASGAFGSAAKNIIVPINIDARNIRTIEQENTLFAVL